MDADTELCTTFNDYPEPIAQRLNNYYYDCYQLPHDYPELQVVFDFFADNPQKVMPTLQQSSVTMDHHAAGSASDDSGTTVPRQDPYWESIRIMQTSELFMEGMLLRSVDCKRKQRNYYAAIVFVSGPENIPIYSFQYKTLD